jgi:cytochrome c-type biogenesis protein CcmH
VRLLTLAVCLCLAVPASAAACPQTTLGDVEDEVMCLECGVPLNVAEGSLQANQERAFITREIAACKSKDQIKAALASQYGDRVLAAPKATGFGLAAYVVPVVAFLLAAAAVALGARRWRRRRTRTSAPPPPDPRDSARLEADLGRYDGV